MRKNDIVTLRIEEINNLGFGVGHTDVGQVVFVKDAVTDDLLDARIIKVTKNYLVACIETLRVGSPLRNDCATCTVRGCGGCVYQNIKYEHELAIKRDCVKSAFRKAGLPNVVVENTVSTYRFTGYRNKAQYPVTNGKKGMQAGFFATGTHRVVPCMDCSLQPSVFGKISAYVCAFCDKNGIAAYDEESRKGLLRHIYLRMGAATGEVMVCLVVNGMALPHEKQLADGLCENFRQIKSVLLNTNTEHTNVVLGREYRTLAGRAWIEDTLCGLSFRISAGAFYQVNHDACELLYEIAREKAALSGRETVLDLYCGIGSIGLSMAKQAHRVIGVEIVDEAVERATENAARNGIKNAYFYCGDASDARTLLKRAESVHGDVSEAVVIMDPPRRGSTPELIAYLAERGFSRIVYVSCAPDTLARDCALFEKMGYDIGSVTPVDMFPRTGHVESVVCFTRK